MCVAAVSPSSAARCQITEGDVVWTLNTAAAAAAAASASSFFSPESSPLTHSCASMAFGSTARKTSLAACDEPPVSNTDHAFGLSALRNKPTICACRSSVTTARRSDATGRTRVCLGAVAVEATTSPFV